MLKKIFSNCSMLIGFAGVGFVSYGAWLAYPPAGFIVLGFLLMVNSYLIAKAGAK